MPTNIDDASYREHMASVVAEGFTLDPPGLERLSAWTNVLTHLLHARINFERIIDAPDKLGELQNALDQQAFFIAGVMAYCRCFASTGSAIPRLDPKKVFAGRSDGMAAHNRLMALRNTFAAHADRNDLVRLTIAVKTDGDRVVVRHLITSAIPLPEVPEFLEAVVDAEHFVTLSLNKQLDKISAKLGKPVDVG